MAVLYDQLAVLRDRLGLIDEVATSKIGIEPTINPTDYPIVRLVPQQARANGQNREPTIMIYFGLPTYDGEIGLESVYEQLLGLEEAIISRLDGNGFQCLYVRTLYDEDMIEHYKLMAVEAKIVAPRPMLATDQCL